MSQLDPKNALRKTLRRSSAVEIQDGRTLDSVEAAALPPAVRPRRARTLRERAFLGGMLLFIVTVFSWFFDLSGVAEGVEFSPDSFRHRSFWYVVWFGIPVSPPIRHERELPLDAYLREKGYVTPTDQTRWDFVKGFSPGLRGWSGPAKIYCKTVGCWGGASEERIAWSEQNPELAAIVWPQVVKWARGDKYYSVFYLLEGPRFEKAKTPAEMQELIAAAGSIDQVSRPAAVLYKSQ